MPGIMPITTATPVNVRVAERLKTIHRAVRDDQICVLTFDRPGSSANVFDHATLEELRQELDFINAQAGQIKGVIFISAKRSIFIAGLDLHSIGDRSSPAKIRELLELGQGVIHQVSLLPVPTVAAINGAAMGGGFELSLACDYRLATPDRVTKIGLPETKLGLLPAWGGATRLPRLIGLPRALDFILAGKAVAASQALRLGMVDAVVPAGRLVEAAVKKIQQGKPHRSGHRLVNHPLWAMAMARRLRKQLERRTRGHYPAVLKAFEVMTQGIGVSVPDSLALERDGILELVQTEACRNLLRMFFLQEQAKKLTVARGESRPVRRVAVIGAGVMGAGIAHWLSTRELPVILRDLNTDQVARGMAGIAKLFQDGVKRRRLTPREARDAMDRIYPAPGEVPLDQADLVIEAAVENLEVKKKIFLRLDELAGEETVLATNTSALPVSELAAVTRRPERVVGLHFFNPVHRMQLVEIIAARNTTPEVLQQAVTFSQRIGKLPVVVKDSPGFLVNRILIPYLVEAGNLFENGAGIAAIDEAMLNFGMPMGPLRLMDEVGLDVSLHVAETIATRFGDRMKAPGCLTRMTADGRLGRKNQRGFYRHDPVAEAVPDPQASTYVQTQTARAFSREEIQERMVFLMVNEAARCLEEQIITGPAEVDFAMILGTGFAPFRGGPLRYTDSLGAARLVGAMEHLADNGATHFEPCESLRRLASEGRTFYTPS